MLLPIFGTSYKRKKIQKKKRQEKNTKFDSVFLIDKGSIGEESSIEGGKFKIEYLRTQLEFFKA